MTRKNFLTGFALVLSAVASPLQAAELAGYWLKSSNDDKSAILQVYESGGAWDGKLLKLEQPQFTAADGAELAGKPKTDRHNPDEQLRSRQIEGLPIIKGFKPDGDNTWSGATIYNPEDGKTYKCKATMSADGRTLQVRGYIGVSLLGQTQTWTRLQQPEFPAGK